jgi:Ser/Thr protein kinase RdoA (MazF antagonist)
MEEILISWNIGEVEAIEPIQSYWGKTRLVKTVNKQSFILKEKTDMDLTERESYLLSCLEKAGTPVAAPIPTVDGALYASSEGKIFCLYPKLPGFVIDEHYADDAKARARMFGEAIGTLHTSLMKCERLSGFQDMKLIEQIQDWAIPCVQKNREVVGGDIVERTWREIEQEMVSLYNELPNQLIHRDINPANMLFEDGMLTGFVDFDMVVRGPRIFDVCYCGTSILVSGFPDLKKVERWPEHFHSLMSGYEEVCPLNATEGHALYGTLVAIQLLFMAFSLDTQAEGAARCNANVLNWLSVNREVILD